MTRMRLGDVRRIVREVVAEARAQDPIAAMKKLLQLPGDAEATTLAGSTTISWAKKGGHAGTKVIERVVAAARAAGWQPGPRVSGASPDGATVRHGGVYHDEAGNELRVDSRYGGSGYDNRFTIEVRLAPGAPARP